MKKPLFILFTLLLVACKQEQTENQNNSQKLMQTLSEENNKQSADELEINKVVGACKIIALHDEIALKINNTGTLMRLLVQEGQSVKKDDVILELDSQIEKIQLEQIQAELATQKIETDLAAHKIALEKIHLKDARDDLLRSEKLHVSKVMSDQAFEDITNKVSACKQNVSIAEALHQKTLAVQKQIALDIVLQKLLIQKKTLRAPVAGKILALNVTLGDEITPSITIAQFLPEGEYVALAEVDELFAERVKIGQDASIQENQTQNEIARGEVFFMADYLKKKSDIDDNPSMQQDRRVREVKISLNTQKNLILGEKVSCLIFLD
jgi:multidrug efflux pump subunit AcrA (membrane-fusion protein)